MASLRDSFLPVVDSLRGLPPQFGVRRFAVSVKRRTWSQGQAGEGAATDYNIPIIPAPRVRDVTERNMTATEAEALAFNTNRVSGQMYRITGITPRYSSGGVTGGYLAEQLRLWPNRDTGAVENLVALVGDDGYMRECLQVTFAQDRPFGYSMLVKEIDRPRSIMTGLVVTPASPRVARGKSVQLTATGSFSGGAASVMTSLTAWISFAPAVATVDIYGNVTGVAAGSAVIQATALDVTSQVTVTVT